MTLASRSRYASASPGPSSLFVGIALLFAFEQPPFVAPDETAHVGYAHEIAGFDLPEITESPDVPDSAVQWQAERDVGPRRSLPSRVGRQPPAAALPRHGAADLAVQRHSIVPTAG